MTDRIRLDDMTDDQLDALHERLEILESAVQQGLYVAEVIDANGIQWAADSIRRALDEPAQRPAAGTGSGAAADSSTAAGP